MSRLKSCLASAADAVFTIRVRRDAEVMGPGLGILQLLLRLTIFAYIIIYVMIIQKGYCHVVPVVGTLRLSVRAPVADVTPPHSYSPAAASSALTPLQVQNILSRVTSTCLLQRAIFAPFSLAPCPHALVCRRKRQSTAAHAETPPARLQSTTPRQQGDRAGTCQW